MEWVNEFVMEHLVGVVWSYHSKGIWVIPDGPTNGKVQYAIELEPIGIPILSFLTTFTNQYNEV